MENKTPSGNAGADYEARCPRCFRPQKNCYCPYIKPVPSGVKFVFLMHPKEAYHQRTGTGRLAHLSLPESEILVGVDFSGNARLNALIGDGAYMPLLLYPGEDALTACGAGGVPLGEILGGRKLLVVVVDATWFFAKKILRLSPNVRALQKISFRAGYRSQFVFKSQPAAECLSTIESCYYLIKELEAAAVVPAVDAEPLMDVFRRMVAFQLESERLRRLSGKPDRYKTAAQRRAEKRE